MASGRKTGSSAKVLALELKRLQDEPVEGFTITLANDSNLYEWNCAIFGPPDTIYAGGYFKAIMRFPTEYPYSPPSFRFVSKMWHPNIYDNGEVCISILHPPVDDPQSGELPSERWNPTQSVRTVLLSVISLLMEPNTCSPANVDASIMYRRYKDKGDEEYVKVVTKQVKDTKQEAIKDDVIVPTTQDEYCLQTSKSNTGNSGNYDMTIDDMYEDEYESYSEESSVEDDEDLFIEQNSLEKSISKAVNLEKMDEIINSNSNMHQNTQSKS